MDNFPLAASLTASPREETVHPLLLSTCIRVRHIGSFSCAPSACDLAWKSARSDQLLSKRKEEFFLKSKPGEMHTNDSHLQVQFIRTWI